MSNSTGSYGIADLTTDKYAYLDDVPCDFAKYLLDRLGRN